MNKGTVMPKMLRNAVSFLSRVHPVLESQVILLCIQNRWGRCWRTNYFAMGSP